MVRHFGVFALGCLALAACQAPVRPQSAIAPPDPSVAPIIDSAYDPVRNCLRDRRIGFSGARLISENATPGEPGTVRFRSSFGTTSICFVDGEGEVRHVRQSRLDVRT